MSQEKIWHETLYASCGQYFSLEKILYHEKTAHHDLMIFENPVLGRVMTLDGVVQTTERDEFIYHEMLTHVPLLAHEQAKNILIIGGGDGGILREVSRHQQVEQITMVEIDASVVDLCRKYLPGHSAGAYDDPRFKLVIDDGINFVNQTREKFDVIISDCTDATGPGESLFTSAFYQGCSRCLNEGGVFVAQNGVCFLQQDEAIISHSKLSHYFAQVSFYQAAIPTYYGGIMIFAWATQNATLHQISAETLQARFAKTGLACRYYNPAIHTASFALPQYLLDTLAANTVPANNKVVN